MFELRPGQGGVSHIVQIGKSRYKELKFGRGRAYRGSHREGRDSGEVGQDRLAEAVLPAWSGYGGGGGETWKVTRPQHEG